jgi:hypothetical protein
MQANASPQPAGQLAKTDIAANQSTFSDAAQPGMCQGDALVVIADAKAASTTAGAGGADLGDINQNINTSLPPALINAASAIAVRQTLSGFF